MSNELSHYGETFKAWQVKLLGSKPTAEMVAWAHGLGNRPGKQALALAMAFRPEGVTGSQIVIACGAPQNNKRREMIDAAYVKRLPVSKTAEGHTVYKVELTAKGKAVIARAVERAAKLEAAGTVEAETPAKKAKPAKGPAKAKGKGKAKPASGVAAEAVEPTSGLDSPVEGPLADDGATVDAVVTETALEAAE